MLEELKRSLDVAPVVKKGDYNYVIHPITDGIPYIDPSMLNEIVDVIVDTIIPELPPFDLIVTAEAMGIPLATALSLRTGKPFNIIRKREYGLEGEVEVSQQTGYSTAKLYINGLKKGDSILFVDDILSTGGTLRSTLKALIDEIGVVIAGIIIVVEKGDGGVRRGLEQDFGVKIHSLIHY